jgi:diguanylate cyclase (GGDEF)-like protein/PAS domain S-box-containing protein
MLARLPRGSALPREVWADRHRAILVLLWAHVPAVFLFALARGESPAHSAFEATIVAAFALAATDTRRHRRVSTLLAALGLFTCSAVLVHLGGGSIEMHFHYFVMVGVVTLYQEWVPFLAAIGYVVLQHGVAGAIAPESVYNHEHAIQHPWTWAGIHGLFILGMSAAGIATWRLDESLWRHASARQQGMAEAQQLARLGSWEWDVSSGRVTWSDELYRLFGSAPGHPLDTPETLTARVHPDDREVVSTAPLRAVETGENFTVDFRVVLPDGGVRWLHGRGAVTQHRDGRPAVLAGTSQDVTDQRRAESELREALSLLSATLDSTADGILVVGTDGVITSFNRMFAEMWRIPDDVLATRNDNEALACALRQLKDPQVFLAKVQELYARPEATSFDVLHFTDGRVFERSSMPQRVDGEVVGRVWSFRDVTERRRLEEELAHQAFHDSLTGLANQALFRDRVEHALARAGRDARHQVAVLFADLDDFKRVNDSLGHTAGDQLLVAVAERLRGCVRAADTAARLGGDEFAILLEDAHDRAEAAEVADRIIDALRRPFTVVGHEVVVGASVGIAFGTSSEPSELLRNADLAMYTAKSRGKGCSEIFEPAMHAAAVERLELEADLRRALDHGELVVHYQPIVRLADGEITGFEALVRWLHPRRGLLPPATFVPLAEATGLIHRLGREVLERACEQTRRWQLEIGADAPLQVTVNLSAQQLQDRELVTVVDDVLRRSGLEPSSLVLEITESAMVHDTDATIHRLEELKSLGLRLAVDDFGTGYSALGYLQRFPVDVIKIDRSFVDVIDQGTDRPGLAHAIVRIAQTLQLDTVAEGVETAEQAAELTRLGCRKAQGFYFARPQPAEVATRLLRDGLRCPA